jgi:hypothetical protein
MFASCPQLAKLLVVEAIPEHFEPGPRARPAPGPPTNLTGREWAEILKPAKIFFWPEPGPKCCFYLFYTIKCAGGLPKPGPGPSPTQKLRPDASSGMVMGRIFSARNNRNFFEPGPARKMLRSSRVPHPSVTKPLTTKANLARRPPARQVHHLKTLGSPPLLRRRAPEKMILLPKPKRRSVTTRPGKYRTTA